MKNDPARRIGDKSSGSATLIADGCKISGVISGSGNYLISGHVDGDCEIDGTLTLAKDGLWAGTIQATNVIVAGRVEGDIVAEGKVEITDTAQISGTVAGEAIAVAEGAVVEGIMRTTGKDEPHEFVEKRGGD
ncbi:MAG: polymer-forming cytoskeletal protein [Pseudomonadota bacterium]